MRSHLGPIAKRIHDGPVTWHRLASGRSLDLFPIDGGVEVKNLRGVSFHGLKQSTPTSAARVSFQMAGPLSRMVNGIYSTGSLENVDEDENDEDEREKSTTDTHALIPSSGVLAPGSYRSAMTRERGSSQSRF